MNKAKIKAIFSCFVFGTIGLFVRYIPLPSNMIALLRSIIGAVVIYVFLYFSKEKINFNAIQKNLKYIIGGALALAIEWICLFESYRYTTVAISTLCLYMAPVIIILISSIFFKEKLSVKKIICIILAIIGMIFVSGVLESTVTKDSIIGIGLGLIAATMYAIVVFMNKGTNDISASQKTLFQLIFAAILLTPYIFIEGLPDFSILTFEAFMVLLILGAFHTGFTYVMYFDSLHDLPVQSSAIIAYVDPVTAVGVSVLVLQEPTSILSIIGAIIVLASTMISEL